MRQNTRNNQLHNSTITFTLSTVVVPIGQRKWKDILAVDHVDKGSLSFSVSKTMTRILQHRGLHRDRWEQWIFFLLRMFCRDCGSVLRWTNRERLYHLHTGRDKKIFQRCLNSDGSIHYMRAVQDHSGGNKVDPLPLDNVKIPYMRSEYICQVGSSLCRHSFYPFRIDCRRTRYKKEEDKQYFSKPLVL